MSSVGPLGRREPVVAVSYSSLEAPFIDALLTQCLMFSSRIYVAVGTHLYSGDPEDVAHIDTVRKSHPEASFVNYPVHAHELHDPVQLHNRSRIAALQAVPDLDTEDDWILFLDGDEVPDGKAFAGWLQRVHLETSTAYKLANYWYFLTPRLRAKSFEDSVLLVSITWLLDVDSLTHPRERDGILLHREATASIDSPSAVRRTVVNDLTGKPMFHHFSWVRQHRSTLVNKVSHWGHRGQRDWVGLLHDAWARLDLEQDLDRDFVHGHELETLDADPLECLRLS